MNAEVGVRVAQGKDVEALLAEADMDNRMDSEVGEIQPQVGLLRHA